MYYVFIISMLLIFIATYALRMYLVRKFEKEQKELAEQKQKIDAKLDKLHRDLEILNIHLDEELINEEDILNESNNE